MSGTVRPIQEDTTAPFSTYPSGQFINGPSVREFTADSAQWSGTEADPVRVPCATAQISAALMALDKPGDEVIRLLPFISTVEVIHLGA